MHACFAVCREHTSVVRTEKAQAPKVPMGYSWSGNEQIVSIPRTSKVLRSIA